MTLLFLFARILLCAVFLVAGMAKLADLAGSRQAMRDFGVPGKLADIFGLLLPVAELAIAIALLIPITVWWGAIGALGLLQSLSRVSATISLWGARRIAIVSVNCTQLQPAGPP